MTACVGLIGLSLCCKMACGTTYVFLCAVFVLLRVTGTQLVHTVQQGKRAHPAPEFSRHTLVKPRYYHGRDKREISSTAEDGGGGHIHDLTIGYDINGKDYVLDLRLNRELIPDNYFEKYQHNGNHVVNRPTGKDLELCQYQGKLRGVPNSWASISTCHGLSGMIYDGEELHYLERGSDPDSEDDGSIGYHFLYRHADLITNQTCGYTGTPHHIIENQEFNRILRYKRDAEIIRGPYNGNKQSRYVELVLVVDNREYKELQEDLSRVFHHCKHIANLINSLYVPLNIFIALVGVVVWTESDEITLSNNGDHTLTSFLLYRRTKLVKEHPNDNAQLLTRVQFEGGVVGKALKGPICTYEFSGGVSMDHSNVVGLVATTVAHEMGHNFGMEHDTSECKCPKERCIMAPSSSQSSPTQWSSCSLEYLALAFEHGMDYCLRNKPASLFGSPVCGNGFVEAGEQCDCGLKGSCDNPCCNATSCMLYANASCATGECCDLQTCRPKTAGSMCRSADHECDLPEYCTGQSEYCPGDVYKMDGEKCDHGKAFCYQGSCRTHSDQCRLLWGPSGKSSDMQCYNMNNKGTRHGNCGYNRLNKSFFKCTEEDVYCGMLHCRHLNERLEFGMESVAILSHSFINSGGSIIPCRTAIVDLGLNEVDPGLAPDGAKCGEGKMCVHQRCMPVASLRAAASVCPQDCNGNGVCNSRGHCHCKVGFAPPLCDYPGTGGSEDSGPASDPNIRVDFMTALYVIFLGIVPIVALIALFMYYTQRNVKLWWKKGGRTPASGTSTADGRAAPLSKPTEKKTPQWLISRGNPLAFCSEPTSLPASRALEISGPLPADMLTSDSAHTSLLPKGEGTCGSTMGPSPSGSPASLQDNFFGRFKGFSIIPLGPSSSSPVKVPSPLSRTAGPVSPPVVPAVSTKPPVLAPKSSGMNGNSVKNTTNVNVISTGTSVTSTASAVNPSSSSRPLISSPVLDATTCTAKELIEVGAAASVPTRPAPMVPTSGTCETSRPPRPISSPNTLAVANLPSDDKKKKDSGSSYPTLTRLASFMMRQNPAGVARTQSQSQAGIADKGGKGRGKSAVEGGSNSLPRIHHYGVKANKLQIDRDTLRNLEISNPIPQQDIEIPQNTVPVRPAPPVPEANSSSKQVVMRAQSLRGSGPVTQRPSIPTFGSMRHASGTKRPTSIPSCTRPTSPPPRPPPPPTSKPSDLPTGIIGMPGYQNPPQQEYCYDDCFNLLSDSVPPLANIDEETSPTAADNIYAVIEESPPEQGRRKMVGGLTSEYAAPVSTHSAPETPPGVHKSGTKFEYSSPTFNEYKSPKPIENSVSAGSVESVGLLSEIVNEIQARNMESIYSTSTLRRKKKQENGGSSDDDGESTVTATDSSVAGSTSPQLFRDKNSAVASSNSSLGTYVNAPYVTYKPTGSVYSNLSSQNTLAASSRSKPSTSCSSSSSGYLSPMMVNTSVKPTPEPVSSPTANTDITGRSNSREFSTFKAPPSTKAVPSEQPAKDKEVPGASKTETVQSYKPYSSSLQRSAGPFAAAFQTASSKGSKESNVKSSQMAESKSPAETPGSASVKGGRAAGKSSSSQAPTPPGTSAKSSGTAATTKTGSSTAKSPLPAPKANASNLHKVKAGTNMATKTPDVVSSCAVNASSNANKSPDVVGGKSDPKQPSRPEVVPTTAGKPKTTTVLSKSNTTAGTASSRNPCTPDGNVGKAPNTTTGKPMGVSSSFKGITGKQPQTAPKPSVPKPTSEGTNHAGETTSASEKRGVGNAFKENNSKGNVGSAIGKVGSVSKSASDASGNRTMPAAARVAANKLSHVASLQQKFETVASASGNDKATPVVNSVASRTASSGTGKGRPAPSVAHATRGANFKK